jgi:hypothetical protein
MNLFQRKQDQIEPYQPVINPFSKRNEPRSLRIELDLIALPRALEDPGEYSKALTLGAEKFPWFGDFHIAPSRGISYELRKRTIPGIRRVLFSFLGGRPMTAVAERVPTSRRTTYEVVRRAIYYYSCDIELWTDLGLIRVWDIPQTDMWLAELPNNIVYQEDSPPVICLMCHRLIGHIAIYERSYDSSLVENFSRPVEHETPQVESIRGHLIAHFLLDGNPWPNGSWNTKFGRFSNVPGGNLANRWIDQVDPRAVGTANNHRYLTLPVTGDHLPTEDEVSEYYRDLLE